MLNGDVDVATTFVDARQRYIKDFPDAMEKTRILGYTRDIPNISVTVRGDMKADMKQDIKNALLSIAQTEDGGELLKELFNMYGFVEALDKDYDVVRETAKLLNIDLEAINK